jgi:hypothetical protein
MYRADDRIVKAVSAAKLSQGRWFSHDQMSLSPARCGNRE